MGLILMERGRLAVHAINFCSAQPLSYSEGVMQQSMGSRMGTASSSHVTERRAGPRYPTRLVAQMTHQSRTRTCVVRDVSISGAQLLARGKFDVGSTVRLDLYLPGGDLRVLGATVARVANIPVKDRELWNYELGLAFEQRLDEDEPRRLSIGPPLSV